MKLSEQLRDAIDGAIECRGRDSQLTEWAALAEVLELDAERYRKVTLMVAGDEESDFCFDVRLHIDDHAPLETDAEIKAAFDAAVDAYSPTDSIDSPQEPLT